MTTEGGTKTTPEQTYNWTKRMTKPILNCPSWSGPFLLCVLFFFFPLMQMEGLTIFLQTPLGEMLSYWAV